MTRKQRNILDDVVEGVRRILDDLENAFNPEKHREPAKVPVPIPVEPNRRQLPPEFYKRG